MVFVVVVSCCSSAGVSLGGDVWFGRSNRRTPVLCVCVPTTFCQRSIIKTRRARGGEHDIGQLCAQSGRTDARACVRAGPCLCLADMRVVRTHAITVAGGWVQSLIWTRSADVDVGLCIAAAGSKCEYPILAQFGFQPSTKQNVLMLTHIGLVVCKMF